jgi:hypothetical protein
MSTESAAVYFDERRVVENPGYIQRTCERVDLSVGEHDVKLRSCAFCLCMSCKCGLLQLYTCDYAQMQCIICEHMTVYNVHA